MNTPRIGIIIATTREGRFGDKAAASTQTIAAARGDMYLELLDLRDYPMPFFNEPTSPLWPKPKNEVALRWAQKVAGMDGFIFVTAEYNHSVPAVLKNSPPLQSIVRHPTGRDYHLPVGLWDLLCRRPPCPRRSPLSQQSSLSWHSFRCWSSLLWW